MPTVYQSWPDTGTLSTIASVIAAFGAGMLFFRIQRELQMRDAEERNWIPWADWLLVSASLLALLGVLLPLVAAHPSSWIYQRVPAPACATTIVLIAFYPAAILAHYRLILDADRTGPRDNPEPGEKTVVWIAIASALVTALWTYTLHAP
jgi:hypothetical protein